MADDWEDNDWEKEDFNPVLPAVGAAAAAAVEAKPDEPTFEDEDQEAEPETKDYSIKPQVIGCCLQQPALCACACAPECQLMHLHPSILWSRFEVWTLIRTAKC